MCKKAILICFISIVLGAPLLKAQDAQMEAKAAYQLAEDSYSKGNYKNAIQYLQQVKTALGTSNCKILFLEIMISNELYAKDKDRSEKLLALIDAFEKSADNKDFNEEKKIEVTKMKLSLKMEQINAKEEEAKRKDEEANKYKGRTAQHQASFMADLNANGGFNISLEELGRKNPGWKVKKWLMMKVSPTVDFYHPEIVKYDSSDFPFPHLPPNTKVGNTITGIYMKEGKVIGIQLMEVNFDQKGTMYDGSYKVWEDFASTYIPIYSNKFYLNPEASNFPMGANTVTRYRWTEGQYGVMIDDLHYPYTGGGGLAKMIRTLFYNSTSQSTHTYHPSEK